MELGKYLRSSQDPYLTQCPDKAIIHQLSKVLGIPQDGGSDLFSIHITQFPPASQVVHRHC